MVCRKKISLRKVSENLGFIHMGKGLSKINEEDSAGEMGMKKVVKIELGKCPESGSRCEHQDCVISDVPEIMKHTYFIAKWKHFCCKKEKFE